MGRCLIFDSQVTRAVFALPYPELAPLKPALWPKWQGSPPDRKKVTDIVSRPANYTIYLRTMYEITRGLGPRFDAEDLERFLFCQGRDIGAQARRAKAQATRAAKAT